MTSSKCGGLKAEQNRQKPLPLWTYVLVGRSKQRVKCRACWTMINAMGEHKAEEAEWECRGFICSRMVRVGPV